MINFFKVYQRKLSIKYLLSLLILFSTISTNLVAENSFSEYNLTKLSTNPVWLKLLYYNKDSISSDVISKKYFLAKDGHINAKSELKATIEAYFNTQNNIKDDTPICTYPARYYWLSKHVDFPNYTPINAKCKKLNKAMKSIEVDSYSLVFVDGYLANPASAFGHSFLKVNVKNQNTNLFDISIGYAADVTANEQAFLYVLNGLFGGYEAKFTDKYYFTNDIVYSQRELRDIWEYRLNLSDEKNVFITSSL